MSSGTQRMWRQWLRVTLIPVAGKYFFLSMRLVLFEGQNRPQRFNDSSFDPFMLFLHSADCHHHGIRSSGFRIYSLQCTVYFLVSLVLNEHMCELVSPPIWMTGLQTLASERRPGRQGDEEVDRQASGLETVHTSGYDTSSTGSCRLWFDQNPWSWSLVGLGF